MDLVVDQPIRMPISPRTVIALGPQQEPIKKQTLEHLRQENLLSARLRCSKWSRRAAKQTIHSIAESRLSSYNSYVDKYVSFSKINSHDFTDEHNVSALAEFLCKIADSYNRPESAIKSSLAALPFFFEPRH